MERMRFAFRAEALELLSELDASLLALEAAPEDGELVHRVFRAIHTVKGSGATAGFTHLAAVAHKVEEAFDLARSGRLPITAALVDCGLKACDVLRAILAAPDSEQHCAGEREVAQSLAALLPNAQSAAAPLSASAGAATAGPSAFAIAFRPHRELFYSGTDPMTLLDELRALGQAHVTAQIDAVPALSELEPESCYLAWEIRLVTDHGEAAVREVFTFVEQECDISIRLLDDQSSAVAVLGRIPAESLEIFAAECRDHLDALEQCALTLEKDGGSRESLDALFRAVHTIKGNAGLLLGQVGPASLAGEHPLPALARLAHAVESRLDPQRQAGGSTVTPETVAVVLEARDAMQGLVESVAGACGYSVPAHLLERLGPRSQPAAPSHAAASAFQNTAAQCLDVFEKCLSQLQRGDSTRASLKAYHRALKTLSSAAAYQRRSDLEVPVAAQLRILDAALQVGRELTAEQRAQLHQSFETARACISGAPGAAAPPKQAAAPPTSTTIRIDQEKLDRLMRVVGELLIAKGAIPALIERLSAGEDRVVITRMLKDTGADISHIAEELQASVMAIRMLPVKTVFQKFPRLVRDLAHNLGKEVQLVVEGETIELDKTILEQIGDPLVHLVRNAVDHGLERPEARTSRGKPCTGQLTLRAANDAGYVSIQVEDDGRGLDADALKKKAVEKGLMSADAVAAMSYVDACRLVFLPGLSTAEKVTEVSGRGVGMDVVRKNIGDLQGTVDIASRPGEGTTFSIKLPTSLIVSKGILLEAGGQEYILPLASIRDMVKIPVSEVHDYRGRRLTRIRGSVYPLFSLAELFGLRPKRSEEISVAVVESGKAAYGLIADRFASEVEVLIKPLSGGLENCTEFHGAAIMGDGRVVLVLNPGGCHPWEGAR
jgi:two-component system, chemotaxis family, sensor kinase CheA